MNRVTRAYLDACAAPDSPLRTAGRQLRFEPNFGRTWGAKQLARPLFVPEAHLRQAAADLHTLHQVVFSLPERLFDGDVARLCAALGMAERPTALALAATATGRTPLYARPDLYYDGTRFSVMELNSGSELGGLDAAAINQAYLELPHFRSFAEEHQLDHVFTAQHVAEYLRELAAPVTGGADPVVALIDISSNIAVWNGFYDAFVAHMRPLGIDVRVCHIAELGSRGGKLTVDGTPVDVAMRYFTLEEICAEAQAEQWLAPVLRAHAEGTTVFYASLDYGIHANKGVLAMVSELRDQGALSDAEAAMVDRILPWTRRVTPEVWEHCRDHRERLVIKPTVGSGGAGVTTGWNVGADEWEAAFTKALDTPHLVQERVTAMPEPVPTEDGTLVDWEPVYGIFVFEHGYAGVFIRTLPVDAGGVVNVNTGAGFTSVFSFPGE